MRTLWKAGLFEHLDGTAFHLYVQRSCGEDGRITLRDGDTSQAICDSLKDVSFDLTVEVVGLIMSYAGRRDSTLDLGLLKQKAGKIRTELHRHCFRNQMRHFHICGCLSMEDAHQLVDEHYVEDVMEA